MKNSLLKKILLIFAIFVIIILATTSCLFLHNKYKKVYYAEDFGIKRVYSNNDKNSNGIDDYTDILLGARKDAENNPTYKSAYYKGGYPPDNEGVCTDVVWRAFKNAGYSLKDMVDEDIAKNVNDYPAVNGKPDPNIDFRRVRNLKVYFEKICIKLTNDPTDIAEWQAGDIVIFGSSHIGIISDKRNKEGITYLIHNASQPLREEDALILWNNMEPITGHYRLKCN